MDILERISAYDCSDGGHSDAAQGSAYDLLDEAGAEIERLRANQERMWCKACGTVTRDRQCDCTKFSDQDTQSLVNYADAMQEAAHEEAQEIERLQAALKFYADPFEWKRRHDPCDDIRVPDFYSETSFGDTATAALAVEQEEDRK